MGNSRSSTVTFFIAGDYYIGKRMLGFAEAGDNEKIFTDLAPVIKGADCSIVNLETVITDGQAEGVAKTGPGLKSPPSAVAVLKDAGFKLVTLANNHIMDFGVRGLETTIAYLQSYGIDYVGAGLNLKEATRTKEIVIKGQKFAIVNIAENEFSTTQQDDVAGAHPMDPISNYRTIKKAKEVSDHVIVIVHGGHEMYQLPSPRMKQMYRFFVEAGASVVINHHQHCLSGMEEYLGVPIFYGLGNFVFDEFGSGNVKHRDKNWNRGFGVKLEFSNSGCVYTLVPYIQNDEQAGVRRMAEGLVAGFKKEFAELSERIADDGELQSSFEQFCSKSSVVYSRYLEPYSSKWLHRMKKFGLMPSLLKKRKRLLYLNLIRCEAHRDVVLSLLKRTSK